MYPVKSNHPPGTVGVISPDLSRFTDFPIALLRLLVPAGSSWRWVRGNGIAENRNMVVRQMTGEWLWFIDDDQSFTPDVLMRLLDRNVDLVGPLIATRKPPYRPHVYRYENGLFSSADWTEIPDGLSQWGSLSASGLLIRKHVLGMIPDPWFEEGTLHPEKLGEDLSFCEKAVKLGVSCFVDADVQLGHCATHTIWPVRAGKGWDIGVDLHDVRLTIPPTVGTAEEDKSS